MLRRLLKRVAAAPAVAADAAKLGQQLFQAGERAFAAGEHGEAERLFAEVTDLVPAFAEAWFLRALACNRQNHQFDACRHCARALALEPNHPDRLEVMRILTIDVGKSGEVDLHQPVDWVTHLARGNACRLADRIDAAELAYRTALAANPASPFVHRRLGSLLAILGRVDEADGHFRISAAAGLAPDSALRLSRTFIDDLSRRREDALAALTPLRGSPGRTTRPLIFFLSCDPDYFRTFAYALLNSICTHCADAFAVHLHIVNPDQAIFGDIDALARNLSLDQLFVTHEQVRIDDPAGMKTYYACARFLRFPALLRAYARPIWMLDLDQLVVADIRGVQLGGQGEPDIALIRWHPTRSDPWGHLSASAVYARPSEAAIEFLERAAAYIARFLLERKAVWFLDQLALFAACAHAPAGTSIRYLDPALVCLADPAAPVEPPASAVFWTVVNSIAASAGSRDHPVFKRYEQPRDPAPPT